MNYKMVLNTLGKVFLLEAFLLVLPMCVGFCYHENSHLDYLIPIVILLTLGLSLVLIKTKEKSIYAKEGFIIVSLAWILMSVFGAIPFVLNDTSNLSFVRPLIKCIQKFPE